MRCVAVGVVVLGVLAGPFLLCAQKDGVQQSLPQFEVISIKPAPPVGVRGISVYPGGKVEATLSSPLDLIMAAYDIQAFQVEGAPHWGREDWVDVTALPPADSPVAKLNPPSPKTALNETQRLMMQALLRDRFHLQCHWEKKMGTVYVLTRGSKPLKLEAPHDVTARAWIGSNTGGALNGDGIQGSNITMPELGVLLSRCFDRPVVDQTGLPGAYDFTFHQSAEIKSKDDLITSIYTAVEGIGLKLKPGKAPVETLVIDHVEKPTAN